MPFARASELDRLLECAGSARGLLERAEDQPGYVKSEASSRGAMWGTLCHRWAETGVLPDNEVWAKPLERKIKLSGMDRLKQWPGSGEHEVALAYNVVTGKSVRCVPPTGAAQEYKDHWKAGFDDEWVTGTLDYVDELMDAPWVDDLKTGKFFTIHEYEAQQAFYTLAWVLCKYGELRDSRSTLTHWPRYPLEQGPRRYGGVLEVDYLASFQKKLVKLRDQILRARKDRSKMKLSTGPQCRFCPSKQVCPKLNAGE